METLIIILGVFLAVTTAIYATLYLYYKDKVEVTTNSLNGLQEEYSKLVEAYRIKKENKEKADEKISDLHSGKLSADDVLPKRNS